MVALSALLTVVAVVPFLVSAEPANAKPTKKCTLTLCADGINACGEHYGGCYPACEWNKPFPTFKPPPCKTKKPTPTPCPVACFDGINECGEGFGACLPHCPGDPAPVLSTPACPKPTPDCPVICVDLINECGMMYGGCVQHCEGQPFPTFSKPPCPTPTKHVFLRHEGKMVRAPRPTPPPTPPTL